MVAALIVGHAEDLGIDPHTLKRLWLHQANINMNEMIGHRVLGRHAKRDENVIILNEYANTSSAGSIIAFHKHSEDMAAGDLGLICSFGRATPPARSSSANADGIGPRPALFRRFLYAPHGGKKCAPFFSCHCRRLPLHLTILQKCALSRH